MSIATALICELNLPEPASTHPPLTWECSEESKYLTRQIYWSPIFRGETELSHEPCEVLLDRESIARIAWGIRASSVCWRRC